MKTSIYREDWNLLTDNFANSMVKREFLQVTASVNMEIIKRLKVYEIATLEILENRSKSTVYRIKQYDEIIQVYSTGEFFVFNSENYANKVEDDLLLTLFNQKEPVFKVESVLGDKVIIMHLKNPRFRALFVNNSCEKVEWIDPQPIDANLLSKLINKARAFYNSYKR